MPKIGTFLPRNNWAARNIVPSPPSTTAKSTASFCLYSGISNVVRVENTLMLFAVNNVFSSFAAVAASTLCG